MIEKQLWVLEYRLKSGTKVRSIPMPEVDADLRFFECLQRGEEAVLLPAEHESLVTWSRR